MLRLGLSRLRPAPRSTANSYALLGPHPSLSARAASGVFVRQYNTKKPRRKRQTKSYKNQPRTESKDDPLNMRGVTNRKAYLSPDGGSPELRELANPAVIKELVFDAELVRQLIQPNPDFSRIDVPHAWNPLPGDTTPEEEIQFAMRLDAIQQNASNRRHANLLPANSDTFGNTSSHSLGAYAENTQAGKGSGRFKNHLDNEDIVPLHASDIVQALGKSEVKPQGGLENAAEDAVSFTETGHLVESVTNVALAELRRDLDAGDMKSAKELAIMLEEAGEKTISDSVVECIVSAQIKDKQVHPAADTINDLIIQRGRKPTVPQICALLDGLLKMREVRRAKNIWDSLNTRFEIEENLQLTRTLMHLEALQQNGFGARRRLIEFEGSVLDIGSLRLNDMGNVHDRREVIMVRDVYHYAMQACARDKDNVHYAFDIFQTMRHHNLPANSVTLSILLNSCQTLLDYELAEEIWVDLTQNEGVVPDTVAYSSLLSVYQRIAHAECAPKPKADYWQKNKPVGYKSPEPYDQARDLVRILKYLPTDAYFNPHYDKLLIQTANEHAAADAEAKYNGTWHEAFEDLNIADRDYFLRQLQKEQLLAHGDELTLAAQQRAMRAAALEGAKNDNTMMIGSTLDGTAHFEDDEGEFNEDDLIHAPVGAGAAEMGLNLPLMMRQDLSENTSVPETLFEPVSLSSPTPDAVHDLLDLPVKPKMEQNIVDEFSKMGYDGKRMQDAFDHNKTDEEVRRTRILGSIDDDDLDDDDNGDFGTLDDLMAALSKQHAVAAGENVDNSVNSNEVIPKGYDRLNVPDAELVVAMLRTFGHNRRSAEHQIVKMSDENFRKELAKVRENKHLLSDDLIAQITRDNLQSFSRPDQNRHRLEDDDDDIEDFNQLDPNKTRNNGKNAKVVNWEDLNDDDFDEDGEMTGEEIERMFAQAEAQLNGAGWGEDSKEEAPDHESSVFPPTTVKGNDGILRRVWAEDFNDTAHDAIDEHSALAVDPREVRPFGDAVPSPEEFKSDRAHMFACADALYAQALDSGITPSVDLVNSYLAVKCSGLSKTASEQIFNSEYDRLDLKHDKFSYLQMIKMYCRMKRLDNALDLFETSLQSLGGAQQIHGDSAGNLVKYLAKNMRVEEALDILRFMKTNNLVIHEHYLRILRSRCKFFGIKPEHGLIPEDPHAWRSTETIAKAVHATKYSKKGRKRSNRMKSIGHKLTERLYR